MADPTIVDPEEVEELLATPAPPHKLGDKKITNSMWIDIRGMIAKGVPVRKICKAYKVTPATIYKGCKRRKIQIGVYVPTNEEILSTKDREEMIKRIKDTKDRDYVYTDYLQRQIITLVKDAVTDKNLGSQVDEVRVLKMAMESVARGTANKWKILGLDQENEDIEKALVELPIREMSDDETEAMRDAQMLEDDMAPLLDAEEEADIIEGEDEDTPATSSGAP